MNNLLELKAVNELNKMNFFIPSYQRGYRWGEKEVTELLDDISEFTPKPIDNTNEYTWYCLQPIVIKKRNETNLFEVIDGQQRLTTIYLILYYLNQLYTEENRDKLFELSYETRETSGKYLKEITKGETNSENIDFHYISSAFQTITKWFKRDNFDRNNFQSKFKFNTKIIWYESKENDPISIFTRINIGKIPLTNSELIKALFLNSSNFEKSNNDKIRLRQLEISNEWDQIEQALQNDRFWYFINGGNVSTNRIEFIFNLMNDQTDENDHYSTFRFFNKKFKNKTENEIIQNWTDVKDYFQRFQEWFNEKDLYHKIGFLINCGEKIETFILQSQSRSKTDFCSYLDDSIRNKLKKVSLEQLQYGDKEVKPVLLLYNILTMLNNESETSFFPFDLFKKGKWDIEHITSIKDKLPDVMQQQWLEDTYQYIEDDKLREKIDRANQKDFEKLYDLIIDYFNKELTEPDTNDISNLTLLDSQTNRGYKNAVFPVKRKTIIQREKDGTFVPICTKNTFLKYFSEYPPRMSFWSQDDRDNYFEDLETVLKPYLTL